MIDLTTHQADYSAETICHLDCADTCSLRVDVKGNEIIRVRGSKQNPVTDGKICSKVATGMVEWVHGDKRLKTPLRRVGKKGDNAIHEPISWDEAYDEIVKHFNSISDSYGSEAILPLQYSGPMGVLSVGSMDIRFFNRLGSSILDSKPLCAGISTAAWDSVFGDVGGIAPQEMVHSKLMVVWANNITVGNVHLTKTIRQARKNGAKLVVIDPKRIRIAEEADLFIQINPGTDVVLAYAVANLIRKLNGLDSDFIKANVSGADLYLEEAKQWTVAKAADICGISEAIIWQFAEYWCNIKPAAITIGTALERTRSGGSAIRAAMSLPLLTGNFGALGAGICDPSSYFNIDRHSLKYPEGITNNARTINILDVGQHIVNDDLDPPIKALFIYNHNPVAVHPRQQLIMEALAQDDLFVVGYDVTMTDSMAYADIILPACSSMEYSDLYKAYGHGITQRSRAVIPAVGEARHNTRVFRELAERFGFNEPELQETDQQMLEKAMANLPEQGESLDRTTADDTKVVFRQVKPATQTAKALLYNEDEQQRAALGLPQYLPLAKKRSFTLISPSSDKRTNSTFGGTKANNEPYCVEINTEDAIKHQLIERQKVRLINEHAEVILTLKVSDKVKVSTAYVPKGAWRADSESNVSVNALIPNHKADMADGACYNDTQIDIVALFS